MSKIKVYELAKELGKTSKELMEFLAEKNIEVKSHMSALEDEDTEMLRKAFGKKKEEGPKKKNIVHVFRPQNLRDSKPGNRQGRSQGNRPAQGQQERSQGSRPVQNQAERPQGNRPAQGQAERPQGSRPVQNQAERPQGNRPAQGQQERSQGGRPSFGQADRQRQSRPVRPSGDRRDDRREEKREDRREPGDRNRGRGTGRPSGDRRDDRREDRRDQGGRFGDNKDRQQRRGQSIPAPALEGQKPQRNKNKGKDDYKKKDYRNDDEDRMPKGRKQKQEQKPQMQKPQHKEQKQEETIKSIVIPEVLTIQELADKMKVVPSAIVKKLFMQGKIVTVNQEVDYETAEEIALEFDILCEKEEVVDVIEELLKEDEEDEKKMKKRPPVVCVMGHVDHGKTSLLDAIRHTNVIDREAGGITQHIGAYVAEVNGEKITFLDTPGHEAFTAMRMRGANSTDIAILVVAADDGVMPQTVEAINHAKAAGIEIVVAVNKIDKPSANIDRVKQELAEYELIPEDWGGSTVFVPVSAKTGEGLEDLMEMLILTAEMLELKANPNRRARGLVIEAQLDKGKGSVATVLVQKGTLRVGDPIAAGSAYGKVRAMMDDKGRRVKEAGPSMPVEILGLNDVPNAGEVFVGCKNEKEARNFAETFISQSKVKLLEETKSKLSLDDLFTQIQEGNLKELGIVVKADVQGSVEAIKQSLLKLSNDEVVVKIIHGGVGAINESDVSLASASNAIIIGFNVRPDATAKETAEREGVDIRLYRVIYNAIEDVEAAMKGMLDPVFEEKVLGHAEVRQTFKASGVGTIAGAYVLDGTFERDCQTRIMRDGIVIYDGKLASLKRFKDDVKEVRAGYECGFVFENYNDIKEGDQVESFKMVEIPR
ncbi:translation initiation factor IF-2 [Claveliimonas bilis]|uniref:Translation initiation factor IF-2 n=1 Tax=Claveliimonas bilis TaxID=3028070 RepID=A0ABM8IAA2_9FIRM|nr:translation initiation factor IF-2 [Claveliimonas bilis]BDZ77430.1 translation initiation factor IF-2 [Claveliimonas bilis]